LLLLVIEEFGISVPFLLPTSLQAVPAIAAETVIVVEADAAAELTDHD
jgi:hypothetical protein